MSTSVDNRVVKMEFDNAQFEQGVSQSLATLTRLDAALNDLENAGGFKGLSQSIQGIGTEIEDTFSFRGVAALTTFQRIAETVINTVVGLFGSLKNNYMPVDFIDQALSGGRNRAANIEDAKFRIEGLGVAYEDLADDINYAVKGTAYGLDAAAKAASQLVASGIAFGDTFGPTGNSPMAKALRGISGVAAMTNTSYEEIAHIFTTIAGNGKMMTKELRMMSYRGLNVAATLTDFFNGINNGSIQASSDVEEMVKHFTKGAQITESALREMVTDGMVTSDIFFEAMDRAFGEHATDANKTYAGSLSNVRAALSRLGEVYYSAHMENMIEVFNALQKAIDKVKEKIKPAIEAFTEFEAVFTHGFSKFLTSGDETYSGFTKLLDIVTHAMYEIGRVFQDVFPELSLDGFSAAIDKVNDSLAHLKLNPKAWDDFRSIIEAILTIVRGLKDAFDDLIYILSPWLNDLNILAQVIADGLGTASEKVTEFTNAVEKNENLQGFIEILHDISEFLANGLVTGIEYAIAFFQSLDEIITLLTVVGFINFLGIVNEVNEKIEEFRTNHEDLAKTIDDIIADLKTLRDTAKECFGTFGDKVDEIAGRIDTAFRVGGPKAAIRQFVQEIKKFPSTIATTFKPLADLVKGFFTDAFKPVTDFFNEAKKEISKTVGDIEAEITKIGNDIYEKLPQPIKDIIDDIKEFNEIASGCFETVGTVIDDFITDVSDAFTIGGFSKAFETFKEKLDLLPDSIKEAFQPLTDYITQVFDGAKEKFDGFIEDLKGNPIVQAVTEFLSGIRTAIDDFTNGISLETIGLSVTKLFGDISTAIANFGSSLSNGQFKEGLDGLFKSIEDYLSNTAIGKVIVGMWDEVTKALGDAKTKFDQFTEELKQNETIQAVTQFFTEAKTAIDEFFDGLTLDSIKEKFTSFFEDISASFEEFKGNISTASIIEDIGSLFDTIIDYVSSTAVGQFVTSMYEAGKAAIDGIVQGFTDGTILESLWSAITELVGSKEQGTGIIGFFANLVGWHSPWAIMVIAGAAAIMGLAIGFKDSAAMQAIRGALGTVKDTILNLIAPILPALQEIGTSIKNTLTFDNVWKGITTVWDAIKEVATSISNIVVWFMDWVGPKLVEAKNAFLTFFSTITGADFDPSKLTGPLGVIYTGLSTIWGLVEDIFGVVKNMGEGKFGKQLQAVFGMGMLIIIPQIILQFGRFIDLANKAIVNVSVRIKDLITSVKMVISFFNGFGKAIQMNMEFNAIRKTLLSIAVLVGVLGAVIYQVGSLDQRQFGQAMAILEQIANYGITLGVVLGALVLLTRGTGFTGISGAKDTLKGAASSFMEVAGLLIGFGVAVYGISKAFETLKNLDLDFDSIAVPLTVIGLIIGSLVLAVGLISYASPKLLAGVVQLLVITYSVKQIVDVFENLVTLCSRMSRHHNSGAVHDAILSLLGICTSLMMLAVGASAMGASGGIGLMALFGSILLLDKVIEAIITSPYLKRDVIEKNIESFGAALAIVTVFLLTTKAAGKNALGAGVAILAIAFTLKILFEALGSLSSAMKSVDGGTYAKMILVILELVGSIALILEVSKGISLKGLAGILAAGMVVNSLIFVMSVLTGLMAVIAHYDPDALIVAQETMFLLGLVVAAMIGATAATKNAKTGVVTGIVAALITIFAGLAILSIICDPFNLLISMVAMAGVMLALGHLVKAISTIKQVKSIFVLVALAGVLVAAGWSLSQIAQFDWVNIAVAAAAISGVVLALAGVTNIVTNISLSAFVSLIGIAVVAGVVGAALATLAQYDWQGMLAAAGAMALTVAALAAATLVLGTMSGASFLGAAVLIGLAAAVGIFSLAMVGFAVAAQMFADAVVQIHDAGVSLEEVKETMQAMAAGLVAGFIDGLIEGTMHIGEALGPMGEAVVAFFFDVIEQAKESWSGAIETFKLIGDAIATSILTTWNNAKTSVMTFLGTLSTEIQTTFNGTVETVKVIFDGIATSWETALNNAVTTLSTFFTVTIPEFFAGIGESFMQWGRDAISNLGKGFEEKLAEIDIGKSIHDKIFGTENGGGLFSLKKDFNQAGKDGVTGFAQGLSDPAALAELQTATENLAGEKGSGTGVLGWLGKALGWASPWAETIVCGQDGISGLIKGLSDEQLIALLDIAAEKLGRDTVETIIESLKGGEVDIQTVCKALGLDIGKYIGDGAATSLDAVTALIAGKLNTINGLVQQGHNAIGSLNMNDPATQAMMVANGAIDVTQLHTQALKEAEEQAKKNKKSQDDYNTSLSKGSGAAGGAAKSTKDAAEEAKKHADAIKHQNQAVDAFLKLFGKTDAVLNSGTEATNYAKEAIDQLAQVFGKSADEIGMSEESLEELFISMYDTVKSSIEGSVSMFEEFKVEASGSVRDLIHNMESNLEGLDTWGERLAQLAVRGFAPKLIEELQAAGPKAMNQANTLLKATVDEMGQINSLYGQKDTKIEEVTAKVIASMAYATKVQESLAHVSENYAKAMSFEDASAKFKSQLDAFAQAGVDANQTLFGNIETANRQVIDWTEENLEKYHDVLADYLTTDELEDVTSNISKVLNQIGTFGENDDLKIAFSPMLQTESGPELLSKNTIDAYINGILDVAREEVGEFSDEDLLRLDTEGLEIDGIKIKNIFAGINESAEKSNEIMKMIGQDGSLAKSWEDFELAAKKAAAEVAARIDELKINYVDLKNTVRDTVKNQIDLFSKFEEKDAMSSTEILNNMKSQIDGFRNWGANLAVISQRAAEMNFSEDGAFLQMLAQMGPKSSDLIAGIAASTDEEFAAMASMWETSLTLPDEISALVGDSYLNAGLNSANAFLTSINQQMDAARVALGLKGGALADDVANGFTGEMDIRAADVQTAGSEDIGGAVEEGARTRLDSHSPSRVFESIGRDTVQGYVNGVNSQSSYAKNTMRTLADAIVSIAEEILAEDKFFEIGEGVGAGLAAGMVASIPTVTKAAEALMGASSSGSTMPASAGGILNTLHDVPKVSSPSKVTTQYGIWIGQGLANGMRAEIPDVTNRAVEMSNALLEALNTTVTDGLDEGLRPTITPVLDLSDVQNGLGSMNSMFSDSTLYASGLSSGVGHIDLTNRSLSRLADAINGFNNTPSYGNVTINIHTQPGQNAKDIADMTLNRLNNQMKRRRAAMG